MEREVDPRFHQGFSLSSALFLSPPHPLSACASVRTIPWPFLPSLFLAAGSVGVRSLARQLRNAWLKDAMLPPFLNARLHYDHSIVPHLERHHALRVCLRAHHRQPRVATRLAAQLWTKVITISMEMEMVMTRIT